MRILTIQTHQGAFGWHATARAPGKIWAASKRDEPTAAYRCALRAFHGLETQEGRSFAESISAFVIRMADGLWLAVELNPATMASECAQMASDIQQQRQDKGEPPVHFNQLWQVLDLRPKTIAERAVHKCRVCGDPMPTQEAYSRHLVGCARKAREKLKSTRSRKGKTR